MVARFVFSFDLIPHKPKSKKQEQDVQKINKKRNNNSSGMYGTYVFIILGQFSRNEEILVVINLLVWIEVYCDSEWHVVFLNDKKFEVLDAKKIETRIKFPLCYAVAFDAGFRICYSKTHLQNYKKNAE